MSTQRPTPELKATRLKRIVLDPMAGAVVDICAREAVVTAMLYGCEVQFTHNGRLHTVLVSDVLATVREESK